MATGESTPIDAHPRTANRLAKEKSPYLLQHSLNPIDWFPWGKEAFEKAKTDSKPIFLSVGYSTCHWCHVMERESFENPDIAKLLNESFVSIKVDREERPDVDKVYMTFIQATQGGGGWPMSVFLTPDLKPFVGGTYFPPRDSYGRPGFATLLKKIASKWKDDQSELVLQGTKIVEALSKAVVPPAREEGDPQLPAMGCIQRAYEMLEGRADRELGGFGKAPKFPQPTILSFLLRVYARYCDSSMGETSLQMTTATLVAMANGGIHDHVGQGFHRYSTDKFWHVPHFEKMLYDQAQLTSLYAAAFQITKDAVFKEVCEDILLYVSRDLSDKDGGFYSAEDADSYPSSDSTEKGEGAFCVWSQEEIASTLQGAVPGGDAEETLAQLFCHHYGVEEGGNVQPYQDPHEELKGKNVLIVRGSLEKTAEKFKLEKDRAAELLGGCREKLFQQRQLRPRPHRDDKILTAWNGLMISGLSRASSVLGNKMYLERAEKAARFLKQHLYDQEKGTLIRNAYRDANGELGVGNVEGFADDYAFLIAGLLDLFEASQEGAWLEWAWLLQEKMVELFWDKERCGFYSTTDADQTILLRMKEDQDGAEPSPNSLSAHNLRRLSAYCPDRHIDISSANIFQAFRDMMNSHPVALPEMLSAFVFHSQPPKQVIIIGQPDSSDTKSLIDVVNSFYLPDKVLIVHQPGSKSFLSENFLMLKDFSGSDDGTALAYVCANRTCSAPVGDAAKLKKMLKPGISY